LKALSVSSRVQAMLAEPRSGAVLAVFRRGCYLDLDGQIVAIVGPTGLNGPLNIVVDADGWADRVATGAAASSSDRALRVGGVEIDLATPVIWDAALRSWPADRLNTIKDSLLLLRGLLIAAAPAGGLARTVIAGPKPGGADDALKRTAAPALTSLAQGLRRRDAPAVASAARTLAGLGPGLTPSGDDVLLGCLLTLSVLPVSGAGGMRDAIAAATADRTTRISRAYLQAAADGEAGEPWHHLIAAMATSDVPRLTGAARGVMAFGETSGSDTLAGFLLSVDALLG